MHVALRMRY